MTEEHAADAIEADAIPTTPPSTDGGEAVPDPSRRGFLRRASTGSAMLFAGGFAGGFSAHTVNHAFADDGAAGATAYPGAHGVHGAATTPTSGGLRIYDAAAPGGAPFQIVGGAPEAANVIYGHGLQPPKGLRANALDSVTIPPPRRPGTGPRVIEHTIDVVDRAAEIGDGVVVEQWSYGGTVPGPILRATEGDTLRVTLHNRSRHSHNLHLHGRHSPSMDGWEPIPSGESFTYEVTAAPAGLHPYHCHTMPLAQHIAKGLYGAMIVDPIEPREQAHEFVLLLSGWDLDGSGRNDAWTWNGVAGFFAKYPIKVPVGDLVRVYVLNMVEYDPIASFHLHAQTFDVHRTGTLGGPHEHTDTVTLSQGERAMLEFRLPEPGRYMFHPHQHHMADGGAMGWFAAV